MKTVPINLSAVCRLFGVSMARQISWAKDHAVTPTGRIFTSRPCRWKRQDAIREMNPSTSKYGYRYVRIYIAPKKCKAVTLHQLVAELYLDPKPPDKDRVLHDDGNPSNNNVSNLKWGTHQENMDDMIRHGRSLKGLLNFNAKLNDRRVQLAKGLREEGISISIIAHIFGVSYETIRRACSREHWGHIDDN